MMVRSLLLSLVLTAIGSSAAFGQFETLAGTHWVNPGDKQLTHEELFKACETPTLGLALDESRDMLYWTEDGKPTTQGSILSKEVNSLRLAYPVQGGGLPSGNYTLIMLSPTAFLHVEQVSRTDVVEADPYIDRPPGRQVRETFTTEATPWLLCNGLIPPQASQAQNEP